MPPKAKSVERLQQEAAAQRARAAALQHLAKTGAGPSQKEIAQQQQEREKWSNATTQAVQKRLAHLQPQAATPGAPMRDNTLAAMAAQRARVMLQQGGGAGSDFGSSASGTGGGGAYDGTHTTPAFGEAGAAVALPDGWKPAMDPVSGETYYWNETTKATSWKRPKRQTPVADATTKADDDDGEAVLEEGWEEVADPQSGQTYYWHRESNETTWTKPVKKTVSLEQAREAKSRLDAILNLCGPSKKLATQQSKKQAAASVASNTTAPSRKREANDSAEDTELSKKARLPSAKMKNTARMYSIATGGGTLRTAGDSGASPAYEAANAGRPGSVKKQKQLQKTKESLLAKQTELSMLVGKLEDRDTQQQAFTSLLELLPRLDSALVADLYARIEKNKNPGRSSTRRMFVLMLAAMAKCHPIATARLLPRVLASISLRLRDKEVQITDACAILCSAITLYVVPHASVDGKGNLSPRKKRVSDAAEDAIGPTQASSSPAKDRNFQTFEHLVSHLSKETNAVGEHATKCIAHILRPVEFDGSTTPPSDVMGPHGKRVSGFLRVLLQSLVSKMNESTQYAGFSSTFLLLQAVVTLAKLLTLDCGDRDVFNIVLPHLGSLVDAIEDVFRDGPREDWVVRKRGIELLIQLIDLFVCGETVEDHSGRAFFDEHLERIRRLVTEARHDPVSAVRDAALPAVFLFDRLAKLFPRRGEVVAPPSPFKRVYSARGSGVGGSGMKTLMNDSRNSVGTRPCERTEEKLIHDVTSAENETDQETNFDESHGDESASPQDAATSNDAREEEEKVAVPPLKLTPTSSSNNVFASSSHIAPPKKPEVISLKAARVRIRIPRITAPKSPSVRRVVVPFQPPNEDEDAFPEERGDEHMAESISNECNEAEEESHSTKQVVVTRPENARDHDDIGELPMTRAEAAIIAVADGEIDLALRLSFLEDDMTLLRRVLTLTRGPCTSSLSRASRTALCAAFLEFLDPADDDENSDDMWLAFTWLRDLSRQPRFVQQLDPRVLRALELRLDHIAQQPSRAGLVAADILTTMGL